MITGIILASGFSRRMGEDKLLMDFDGKKLLEWTLLAASRSSLDRIILVYRKEEVKALAESYGIETVHNPLAHLGQSEGLKAGLKEAKPDHAYMFLLGDQPFVDSDLIDSLIDIHKEDKNSIIIPSYDGKNAPPTILPSRYRKDLLAIEGDKGARLVIRKYPDSVRRIEIDDPRPGFDIDSPSDLDLLQNKKLPRF